MLRSPHITFPHLNEWIPKGGKFLDLKVKPEGYIYDTALFIVKSTLQNEFIAGIFSWKCVLIACVVRPRYHLTFTREINISETKEMLTSVPHRISIIWRSNWKMRGSYPSVEGEGRDIEVVKQWIIMKTILLSMIDLHMHSCQTVV